LEAAAAEEKEFALESELLRARLKQRDALLVERDALFFQRASLLAQKAQQAPGDGASIIIKLSKEAQK
jgi:hypothetical protein